MFLRLCVVYKWQIFQHMVRNSNPICKRVKFIFVVSCIRMFIFWLILFCILVTQLVKKLPAVQETPCITGDQGSIPGSGRSSGEGNGNPLQYSCLGNPMDRGARWVTVPGVARVRHGLVTELKNQKEGKGCRKYILKCRGRDKAVFLKESLTLGSCLAGFLVQGR